MADAVCESQNSHHFPHTPPPVHLCGGQWFKPISEAKSPHCDPIALYRGLHWLSRPPPVYTWHPISFPICDDFLKTSVLHPVDVKKSVFTPMSVDLYLCQIKGLCLSRSYVDRDSIANQLFNKIIWPWTSQNPCSVSWHWRILGKFYELVHTL